MEGYISGQSQEELDEQFDKDCNAVFEELEGTLDRFYNKEEVPQWDETKEDAQAIVSGEIEAAQAAWDALSAEEQERSPRPVVYNLP